MATLKVLAPAVIPRTTYAVVNRWQADSWERNKAYGTVFDAFGFLLPLGHCTVGRVLPQIREEI